MRMSYPGICSLEFQSVMEFMWKHIVGWDEKEMCGRQGIFGEAIAACESDEEQGRKTLHSHWLVWIKDFKILSDQCATTMMKQ